MIRSSNIGFVAARRERLEYETASDSGRAEEGIASGGNETFRSKQSMNQGKNCISYLKDGPKHFGQDHQWDSRMLRGRG